ncbi:MAG TPA: hypothetical protein VML19_34515 [Verrucomicrobiae bacterium]|nr:hypothetical protein [Verrucomicrobiae bacterium]
MIFALLLLFFSPNQRQEWIPSQVIEVPAHDWGQFEIALLQRPAFVDATFDVVSGPANVRMALLDRADFERLRNGDPHGMLEGTEIGAHGRLHYHVRRPGRYVIVLDNRASADRPAKVRVSVWVDFSPPRGPDISEISPQRRLVVVLISCTVFFSVVTFSLRRILRAVKR